MNTISINEKEYELSSLTMKHVFELEKQGITIQDLGERMSDKTQMFQTLLPLVHTLVAHHGLTFDEVASGLKFKDLKTITERVMSVIMHDLGGDLETPLIGADRKVKPIR